MERANHPRQRGWARRHGRFRRRAGRPHRGDAQWHRHRPVSSQCGVAWRDSRAAGYQRRHAARPERRAAGSGESARPTVARVRANRPGYAAGSSADRRRGPASSVADRPDCGAGPGIARHAAGATRRRAGLAQCGRHVRSFVGYRRPAHGAGGSAGLRLPRGGHRCTGREGSPARPGLDRAARRCDRTGRRIGRGPAARQGIAHGGIRTSRARGCQIFHRRSGAALAGDLRQPDRRRRHPRTEAV